MNESSYLGRVLESFIFLFIILVILQTFGEEFAIYMDYNVQIRKILLIAGFGFDLIFSIEFISRLFISGKKRKTGRYLTREGGIIDFISSLPLLLLNSGPLIYMTLFAGEAGLVISIGSVSFLKIVKVMRLVRILRFIRTLKIFGKVRNRYAMTPKFIGSVLTITISVSVGALIGFTYFENGQIIQSKSVGMQKILRTYADLSNSEDLNNLLGDSDTVLLIKRENEVTFRSIHPDAFRENFFNDDFFVENIKGYEVYFNNKNVKQIHSFIHMMLFSLIVGIIIGTSTIYRRFFNKHIASVINVMLRGFKSAEYSTPVRIKEEKDEYEIYRLADQYNNKWLPVKRRIIEIKRKKY